MLSVPLTFWKLLYSNIFLLLSFSNVPSRSSNKTFAFSSEVFVLRCFSKQVFLKISSKFHWKTDAEICEICEILKNSFFCKTLPKSASISLKILLLIQSFCSEIKPTFSLFVYLCSFCRNLCTKQ